jgi:dynein assembly factor 3, axonemal
MQSIVKALNLSMQVAPYDPRHTLYTVCQATRHAAMENACVNLYIHEETAEALARHIILLAVLLDTSVHETERVRRFLEFFGNAFLRQDSADYLHAVCKQIEALLTSKSAGRPDDSNLSQLFSTSLLSFAEQDLLMSAATAFSAAPGFDMVTAWDSRLRKWYADRYDFLRNMVRLGDTGVLRLPGRAWCNNATSLLRAWSCSGLFNSINL